MAGMADWLAFGLPTEGKEAGTLRVGPAAHHDAPTCGLTDRVGDVREKVQSSGWKSCVVVNDQQVVLGRVNSDALAADADRTAEAVMEAGPTTVRRSEYLDALVKRMQKQDVKTIIVTSSDGAFTGVLRRDDAERRLA